MTVAAPSLTEGLAARLLRPVDNGGRRRAAALVTDWPGCAMGALRSLLATQLAGLVAMLPAPLAVADGELPLALQLVGDIDDELQLIALAEAFRQAIDWQPSFPQACKNWWPR